MGLAVAAGLAAVLLQRFVKTAGLFRGGPGRIPKRFVVKDIPTGDIPSDAQQPLDYLTEKLGQLGFVRADLPVRVPALQTFGYRMLLVPFANLEDSSIFLMGIESHWPPSSDLMLHIITPLTGGRRVETTTLDALAKLRPAQTIELHVVLDADSVEEIWSRHRRALSAYARADRLPVRAEDWKELVSTAYEAWVEAAVRAQRLRLLADGATYRVRSPT